VEKTHKHEPKQQKYTISLDIGTGSVGWAVLTDAEPDVLATLAKSNKKIKIIQNNNITTKKTRTNLWGVRLFEQALTAQDRRLKRGQRRRILRRTKRLQYLQKIFKNDINQFDPNFFHRLQESFRQNKDEKKTYKLEKGKGLLFAGKLGAGETYACDANFYKNYPTIYHLRQHLMQTTHKVDLRMIYLAIHHIIKYRGHFVNEHQKFEGFENFDITSDLKRFIDACLHKQDENEDGEPTPAIGGFNKSSLLDENMNRANKILTDRKLSKTKKAEDLAAIFGKESKDIFTAIVGGSINLEKIFNTPDYKHGNDENIPKPAEFKYSIDAEKFEELMAKITNVLTDFELEILQLGKQVYGSIVLSGILSKPTLSASMVEKYETHEKQLKELKRFVKSACSNNTYKKIFNDYDKNSKTPPGIYAQYINEAKGMPQDKFYTELKKLLPNDIPQDITDAINMETYLPKQRYRVNGEIPFQIHEHELCAIINNQKAHYPFLGELHQLKDGKREYKIQTLMKFRIPYYVGPLAMRKEYSKNSWLEKNSDEKIDPWNFDAVVDKDKSNTNFIERMTAFCTYLPEEKVLPVNSLTYQEFIIYNELMTCGYYDKNEKRYFPVELKQKIVDALFKKEKNVTLQKMVDFLEKEEGIHIAKSQLFGVDTVKKGAKYNGSYSTYIDLLKALKDDTHIEEQAAQTISQHKPRFEDIIKWATIFEDRTILRRRIKLANETEWGHFLNDPQVNRLAKLRYRGWGRLSAKLLTGLKTSENKTILDSLKNGNYNNFMRLLQDSKIEEAIKQAEVAKGDVTTLNYALVDSIAGSPAIKRGIWQSLKVVQELEQFLGRENIDKIVVEISRDMGGEKGKRTKSRWQKLDEFYKKFKENTGNEIAKNLLEELNSYKDNERALHEKEDRLYLYFMQNGKCMYTKEELDINHLSSYEVDHIIPQSLQTDNSIDNKVLVKRVENQKKQAEVLSQEIINKMENFWNELVKNNQISNRKLENLKRRKIDDNDKKNFINRQLVETRQITKHVVNILLAHFDGNNTEILTPKAGLASTFRHKFNFEKNRDINDYHHAHDAFLNAIVALYAYKTFPELKGMWVYGNYTRETNKNAVPKILKNVISSMGEDIWLDTESGEIIAKRHNILAMIRTVLGYRNVNIVKKTEVMAGALYKDTIKPKSKGDKQVPVKTGYPVTLYGGKDRDKDSSAFTVIVKTEKGKVEALPLYKDQKTAYEKATSTLDFLQKLYPKKKIVEIVVGKLGKHTLYRLPNGNARLLASHQEAKGGIQMKMYTPPTKDSSKEEFLRVYDSLSEFIACNNLFADDKIALLKGDMRINFQDSGTEVMLKVINELMSVSNGKGRDLKSLKTIGLGVSEQRLKNAANLISEGTIIMHRSITGLYETQIKL